MSNFKEHQLGLHCNAVVLAWLKEEVECFPVGEREWGLKAGDSPLQTALWLDAVAVKMCLKDDDRPQSGCQGLHVTCPPSLTTILWTEVTIIRAKSRRLYLLGLLTHISLKTSSLYSLGGWVKVILGGFMLKQRSSTRVTCSPGYTLRAATLCRKRSINHFGGRGEKSALSALILSFWPQFM